MAETKKSKGLTQDCQATLYLGAVAYEGATGKNKGHAEMTALDAIIRETMDQNLAMTMPQIYVAAHGRIVNAASRTVFCPSRPVCLKCGAVLQAMNFNTGANTAWSTDTAGSTEWGVSLHVRALLERFDIDYDRVKALG